MCVSGRLLEQPVGVAAWRDGVSLRKSYYLIWGKLQRAFEEVFNVYMHST